MPVTNQELLNQIHLSGESQCASFQPHMLKANFCVACSKLINKHRAEAIPNDEALLKVSEFQKSTCMQNMKASQRTYGRWVCLCYELGRDNKTVV